MPECRRRHRPLALALALGCLTSSVPAIRTGTAAADQPHLVYAPGKLASPFRTDRAGTHLAFPGDLPKRGVLVATGNVLSPQARWIILDLDSRTLRQATTRLAAASRDGQRASVIERDTSRELTTSEMDAVVRAANTVWATKDPTSIDTPGPTDALCSVALFDGNDVLHEFGTACPRTSFVETVTALAVIPQ